MRSPAKRESTTTRRSRKGSHRRTRSFEENQLNAAAAEAKTGSTVLGRAGSSPPPPFSTAVMEDKDSQETTDVGGSRSHYRLTRAVSSPSSGNIPSRAKTPPPDGADSRLSDVGGFPSTGRSRLGHLSSAEAGLGLGFISSKAVDDSGCGTIWFSGLGVLANLQLLFSVLSVGDILEGPVRKLFQHVGAVGEVASIIVEGVDFDPQSALIICRGSKSEDAGSSVNVIGIELELTLTSSFAITKSAWQPVTLNRLAEAAAGLGFEPSLAVMLVSTSGYQLYFVSKDKHTYAAANYSSKTKGKTAATARIVDSCTKTIHTNLELVPNIKAVIVAGPDDLKDKVKEKVAQKWVDQGSLSKQIVTLSAQNIQREGLSSLLQHKDVPKLILKL